VELLKSAAVNWSRGSRRKSFHQASSCMKVIPISLAIFFQFSSLAKNFSFFNWQHNIMFVHLQHTKPNFHQHIILFSKPFSAAGSISSSSKGNHFATFSQGRWGRQAKELCRGCGLKKKPVDYDDIDYKNRSKNKGERETNFKGVLRNFKTGLQKERCEQ